MPAVPGVAVDVPSSVALVLAAAKLQAHRVAQLAVQVQQPRRTTEQARAMGISGTVGTYETIYGGIANRIHNVQLVAHLVDRKLIAPGATFSFNQATGERSAAKGFLEAPVIINGEVETGLGGGVCQVSTTVFNAAYEAGLPITARTNHALYISHYPLGRDATVDYPSVDLKFVNNTPHWLLLRTFVGSDSLVVTLYGAPQHRRVVTDTAPLVSRGKPPVKKTVDRSLAPGKAVVDDPGVPAQSTSVRRRVYDADGKLLSDATWYSSYRAVPELVRVGPKKKPRSRRRSARSLCSDDRLGEPRGHPGRAQAAGIDRRVGRPAVGDHDAVTLDRILVAEAGARQVEAAGVHHEAVVEHRRPQVADVRLEHERLDAESRSRW